MFEAIIMGLVSGLLGLVVLVSLGEWLARRREPEAEPDLRTADQLFADEALKQRHWNGTHTGSAKCDDALRLVSRGMEPVAAFEMVRDQDYPSLFDSVEELWEADLCLEPKYWKRVGAIRIPIEEEL
jgi:hypothetical protein